MELPGRHRKRTLVERLTVGTLWTALPRYAIWNAPQRESFGRYHKKGCNGKPNNRNRLDNATKGIYWKASQREPFGKNSNGTICNHIKLGILWKTLQGILLECITAGICWTALQRDSTGRPHNWNHLERTTNDFIEQPHKRNLVDSTTKGCYLERITTGVL